MPLFDLKQVETVTKLVELNVLISFWIKLFIKKDLHFMVPTRELTFVLPNLKAFTGIDNKAKANYRKRLVIL